MTDFARHQSETAAWMGYPDANAMNRDHDRLHLALCSWLGVESHAMRDADGETLDEPQKLLASLEEAAVLHLQRFMCHAGAAVPETEGKPPCPQSS